MQAAASEPRTVPHDPEKGDRFSEKIMRKKMMPGMNAMRARHDRIIALVFALGLLARRRRTLAHAGPYEDALAGFTTDDFSDTADAVNAVVASGSPLAGPVIEALQDSRLMFSAKDKKVYIKTKDDKLLDAATGKPAEGAPPDDIDAVRLNNRLRGVVDAAVGGLTLMASGSQPALRRGPSGVQVARRQRSAGARQGARRGNQSAREKGDDRGARGHRSHRRGQQPRPTRSPPSRSSATAATRMRSA